MDRKGFLELKEEGIKSLSLNIGKRKKLKKEPEFILSPENNEDEVSKYLKEK